VEEGREKGKGRDGKLVEGELLPKGGGTKKGQLDPCTTPSAGSGLKG